MKYVHVYLFAFLPSYVSHVYCLCSVLCSGPSWSDFIMKMMTMMMAFEF